MSIWGNREALVLFIGDVVLFYVALWITLLFRYAHLPDPALLESHITPFSILFLAWVAVFFIAGLYDKHTTFFKERMPSTILRAQIVNIIIAALFFFLIPYFGIAPKTNLAIYLIVSFLLIVSWRLLLFPLINKRRQDQALLIGEGREVEELLEEVNNNPKYGIYFISTISKREITDDTVALQGKLVEQITSRQVSMVVADTRSEYIQPLLPLFYNLGFLHADFRFLDLNSMYEEIFDKVPLSFLRYDWFLINVSHPSPNIYRVLKRVIDIVGALILGIITLILFPLIYIATKIEDRGPVFITQTRIGQYNKPMTVFKFRTMERMEHGVWLPESKNKVTKVGSILRKTSLDEFPQCLNILRGELSLIGPRNDIAGLGQRLAEHVPYYSIRYVVKPGISGWAQINQRYAPGNISPQSIEETKARLAYDFYYIKHHSLLLDIVIALKTLKRILFRHI